MTARVILGAAAGAAPKSYWISRLKGTANERTGKCAADASNNIYVVGNGQTSTSSGSAGLLIKYNSSGVVQWQKQLDGSSADAFMGVAVDTSGNVYVTGQSNTTGYSMITAKYDSSGALQWQRRTGGATGESGLGISIDGSGNVYVAGISANSQYATITKFNSSGTLQWQRRIGSSNANGNNIVVSGSSIYAIAGYPEILVLKYDLDGTLAWQRRLKGTSSEHYGHGIAVDGSGDVYVAGTTDHGTSGGSDALVAKYNSSGTLQWQRVIGGANADSGRGIAVDASGGVYVCGSTTATNPDGLVVKYNSAGSLQWQRKVSIAGTLTLSGIAIDGAGDLCIAAQPFWPGSGDYNLAIIKIPSDGTLTGTYGSFTYATVSLTDATGTLTADTPTYTNTTISPTDAAAGLTDASAGLTVTRTSIQG